jgi:hypothetical protein
MPPTELIMDIRSNPITLKVQNGTVRGDVNLCRSCRYALRKVGSITGSETVNCMAGHCGPLIREPVAECSAYLDRCAHTLDEMMEIAWQLQTDKGGRKLGFLSPEQLRDRGEQRPADTPRVGF